jgi:protein tyrosine phosphatase
MECLCSAGVGRTGTLIAIDCVLDQLGEERVVDIAGTIIHLRTQRMKMVQGPEQYIFIHDAILEAITCGDTQICANVLRKALQKMNNHDPKTQLNGFETQLRILEKVSPKPEEIARSVALQNPTKNRNDQYLPGDDWRVMLRGDGEDYIHAVFVNGYKQQRAFIIAQSPMQSTARDFWKTVYDRKCGVVVMPCDLVESGKDVCYKYWPSSGVQQVGEYTIDMLGEEKLEGFTIRTFGVLHKKVVTISHISSKLHPLSLSESSHMALSPRTPILDL